MSGLVNEPGFHRDLEVDSVFVLFGLSTRNPRPKRQPGCPAGGCGFAPPGAKQTSGSGRSAERPVLSPQEANTRAVPRPPGGAVFFFSPLFGVVFLQISFVSLVSLCFPFFHPVSSKSTQLPNNRVPLFSMAAGGLDF